MSRPYQWRQPGPGLSSAEVCRRTGATTRQLVYWQRVGAIRPSLQVATGSGTRHRWSYQDARIVGVMVALSSGLPSTAHGPRNHCLTDLFGRLSQLLRTESTGWLVITDGEPVVVSDHLLERAVRAARGGACVVVRLEAEPAAEAAS